MAALAWALYVRGAFLPRWASWQEGEWAYDLDGDGTQETLALAGRRLTVSREGAELFSTEYPEWLVSHALVGDIDRDGLPELVLICWRRGLYGSARPFWVERNDESFSQHVFIGRLNDGQLQHLWMSSYTGIDVADASLDAAARLLLVDRAGAQTLWEWQGWGLTLVAEAAAGEELVVPEPVLPPGYVLDDEDNDAQVDAGEAASEATLSLLIVGDCICHEAALSSCFDGASGSYDFAPVFAEVSPWVHSFDVAVCTQETPLVSELARVASYPLFGTPEAWGDALAGAGFDVVACATNHALNQGTEGLAATLGYWDTSHPELVVLGAYESEDEPHIAYVEKGGIKLAFVDATYGTNGQALPEGEEWRLDLIGDGSELEELVREAEGTADLTVCVLHIGEEYELEPTSEQRALEERLIDAGADVVACSHAHVLQGAEVVHTASGGEGVVFHGLGNFVACQHDLRTLLGGAACLEIARRADGRCVVTSWELEGVVSHCDVEGLRVYRLEDYTDELASRHALTLRGSEPVTVEQLRTWLDEARFA